MNIKAQQNRNTVNNYKDLVKYLQQADAKTFLDLAHERHWLPVTEGIIMFINLFAFFLIFQKKY